ncbi:MAG: CsbD family protein [Alphaproteobacteria bacterium]|nr:CsbD family protein [Alphaproteobacteria bacterium]
MNKDILEGNWKQFKGKVQKKWGKLTDDVLDQINGSTEELLGQIQKNYGLSKEEAEKQIRELKEDRAA